MGDQGDPGVCDCLTLSLVQLDDLGVNGTSTFEGDVIMNGVMTCPGGAMDPSCFGLSVCPDFIDCDLRARSLSIWSANISEIPQLQVGVDPMDQGQALVNFGIPLAGSSVNQFTVNAAAAFSVGTNGTEMLFRSLNSNIVLDAIGTLARVDLSSTGFVTLTADLTVGIAGTQSVAMSAGLNTLTLDNVNNRIDSSTGIWTTIATDFSFLRSTMMPWISSSSNTTLTCLSGPPLAEVAGASITLGADLIMEENTRIMNKNADGLLETSGLKICGTTIRTEGSLLILQGNSSSDTIDVRGALTNGEGAEPVYFSDGNGVTMIEGTPMFVDTIASSRSSDNTVYIHTTEAGPTPGDVVIGESGTVVTFRGDVIVNGALDGQGTCLGCVTSDARVKQNVSAVAPEDDLHTLLSLPQRVKFQFTQAYRAIDRGVSDFIHHSWIAQDFEHVMPRAVHKSNRTVGGEHLQDFRKLVLNRVTPHIVGAVKALHLRDEAREKKHNLLKAAHDKLSEEVKMLRALVHKLLEM